MNILIVDDYQIVRRGIRQILLEEYASAQIDEAFDVESALGKIDQNKYNIVICDLSMPGRGGLDVVYHTKQHFADVPVLIISIHPDIQYAIRTIKAGADGYLNKDTAATKLIHAVKTLLAGKIYIEPAIEEIINQHNEERAKTSHELLSHREFEIFKLIAAGKTVSQIAEIFSLNIATVNTYRKRILVKMALKTNADLTRYALDNKLI